MALAEAESEPQSVVDSESLVDPDAPTVIADEALPAGDALESEEDQEARERAMSYAEMASVAQPSPKSDLESPSTRPSKGAAEAPADVRLVLENGIREIAGEVRNSLDFHRSQEGGGEVSLVVLSGSALDLPGFSEALQEQLGVQVERESVQLDEQDLGGVSAHRLAIAAGLAVEEVPQ